MREDDVCESRLSPGGRNNSRCLFSSAEKGWQLENPFSVRFLCATKDFYNKGGHFFIF